MKLKLRAFLPLLLLLLTAITGHATDNWKPDILRQGYEMRTVDQGRDYSGPVVSTIIRRLLPDTVTRPLGTILYIHGFNDYFFNPELGQQANRHGYDFYAVDLRKYGRSIRPRQELFQCRSLTEHFPDIDSALVEISHAHNGPTILMGHSTGGLITAFYMARTHNPQVDALILNSPFLDWNLGWKEHLVPIISWWGTLFPDTPVSQGNSTAYSESLLKDEHGEWQFRTDWKLPASSDVTAGWVHAIDSAQKALRNGKARINIPILLMYSAESVSGHDWTTAHNRADAVLDVNDIRRYGLMLGPDVTCIRVVGGLHDLYLSSPRLRTLLYARTFAWLASLPIKR